MELEEIKYIVELLTILGKLTLIRKNKQVHCNLIKLFQNINNQLRKFLGLTQVMN